MQTVRCWDCGAIVAASQAVRRNVVTEVTNRSGSGSYTKTQSQRVDLCHSCSAERDRRSAERDRQAARHRQLKAAVQASFVVFLTLALVWGAFVGLPWLQEQRERTAAEDRQQEATAAKQIAEQARERQARERARQETEERHQEEARRQAALEAERQQRQAEAAEAERQRQAEAARLARLEKRAKRHVEYAKKLIAEGETPAKALRERLDKIIKDFAGTPSAEEAKRLRAELKE